MKTPQHPFETIRSIIQDHVFDDTRRKLAEDEISQVMKHQYVWVGHEPFYEKDVLELLNKNDHLMQEIDKLRVRIKKYENK